MKENIDVFDFELSAENMVKTASMDTQTSLFFNHQEASTIDLFLGFLGRKWKQDFRLKKIIIYVSM